MMQGGPSAGEEGTKAPAAPSLRRGSAQRGGASATLQLLLLEQEQVRTAQSRSPLAPSLFFIHFHPMRWQAAPFSHLPMILRLVNTHCFLAAPPPATPACAAQAEAAQRQVAAEAARGKVPPASPPPYRSARLVLRSELLELEASVSVCRWECMGERVA